MSREDQARDTRRSLLILALSVAKEDLTREEVDPDVTVLSGGKHDLVCYFDRMVIAFLADPEGL